MGDGTREDGAVTLDVALRRLMEDTAAHTGESFFRTLVESLTRVLEVDGAWVTRYDRAARSLEAMAFFHRGRWIEGYRYPVQGTPCEPVIAGRDLCHIPDRVVELYPQDPDLPPLGAVSYLGAPLLDGDGEVMGHLAALDSRPLPLSNTLQAVFRIFAQRASSELLRERELNRLVSESRQGPVLREDKEGTSPCSTPEIWGKSAPIQAALSDLARVSCTDCTVLILGESGTGKELFARAVHAASPRRDKPLITLNCAALPAQLVESELFGHEKGAFTGALSRRQGRFALAHRGTLFLDEIGELPLELQAKLLRVLQEGELEPLGSSKTVRVDVRVIAATNRDLEACVRAGTFREDLFYRLYVFPLRIPALRERGEDVLLLAERFMRTCARRLGRSLAPLTAAQAQRLRSHDWPGNVRELQNVIERAAILSQGPGLELDRALGPAAPRHVTVAAPDERVLTAEELRQLERANIVRALARAHGRIGGANGAAAMLGLPVTTLASRIRALGIRKDEYDNS